MKMNGTVTVSQAKAKLPQLLKREAFAISRHGKVVGVYLSRDRIEAMIETMELLGNADFAAALKEYESGKMKFKDVKCLDED